VIAVFFGKPGTGKGTQAKMLEQASGLPAIATGDVLRQAVRDGTPLGLEAKAAMERGDLVPDDVILGIMKGALTSPKASKGAILDGVVRTVPQAVGLEQMLETLGRRLDRVLVFDLPNEEIVRRLSGRTVCESCQTPYTGREPGSACSNCGGTLVRRKDDEPDAVRNRLAVYERDTAPVLDWYRANGGKLVTIDASGTPDDVLSSVKRALAL
jgi:adenylate kinase